jgi:prepilin-type N-terminal cleavage/methylation domain-containing protein
LKNKKGFTLIELLAVIVIIGIITSIVVVNVGKYIGESREKSYDILVETIKDASELYVTSNTGLFPSLNVPSSTFDITLQDLVNEKYLELPITDERTGEDIPLTTTITVTVVNENRISINFNYE